MMSPYRTTMTSFGSLTHDVLSEIFLVCTYYGDLGDLSPRNIDGTAFLLPTFTSMPSTLSRVCKHWRRVAFSTPRLWSRLFLQVGYPESVSDYRRRWSLFLQVEDQKPISDLYGRTRRSDLPKQFPTDEESYAKYWNVVLAWLARSHGSTLKLYIQFHPTKTLPPGLSEAISRCSQVHLVESEGENPFDYRVPDVPAIAALFKNANRIERLEVDLPISAEEMGSIVSHLANLNILRATSNVSLMPRESCKVESLSGRWGLVGCFNTMLAFRNLRKLEIELDRDDYSRPPGMSLILPHLTHLSISGNSITMAELLSQLQFPSLEVAKFCSKDPYSVEYPEIFEERYLRPLAHFLKRNPSKRIALTLCGSDAALEEAQVIELLGSAPYLTSLTLELWSIHDNGLSLLTCGLAQTLCPDLLALSFTTLEACHISVEKLRNMVDSRLNRNQNMAMSMRFCIPRKELPQFLEEPTFHRTHPRLNLEFCKAHRSNR